MFMRIATSVLAVSIGAWSLVGCAAKNEKMEGRAATASHTSVAADKPLIPRSVLFGNPDRSSARISPDGAHLSFLTAVDGVMNVWVGPIDDPSVARPVTRDTKRGIRQYSWAQNGTHILYIQDKGGDENWHVYSTELVTNRTVDLTPFEGVAARIQEVSHKFPDEILIGINDRVPQLHDLHRVNVRSGAAELIQENAGFIGFLTRDDFSVPMAMRFTRDGGLEILKKGGDGEFAPFMAISAEDAMTTGPIGFDKTGTTLYARDSRGRDTAALVAIDIATGDKRIITSDERADIGGVTQHPTEQTLQAVSINYLRRRWQVLDASIAADFEYLESAAAGEFSISSRTRDDRQWIVAYSGDDGPTRYYHYDRDARKSRFLFSNRKALEQVELAHMQPVVIEARDGLKLVSYLTLPLGAASSDPLRPANPQPMVLLVHGGPWGRDSWRYHPLHQWLANRGYAVLSVNFRGSTGFGKSFVNAGDLQWGRKMHDDLIDAVDWAVKSGIADPKRVAIMGGSYGGYATLAGVTMTPTAFTCGVDIVGPSSLITLMKNIPPYWAPMLPMLTTRVGDPDTEDGRKLLIERSPLTYADKIERPLLIGQGANDPRVTQIESDQLVEAMQRHNIPVTYVLFPDEGHGFRRPENNMSFMAVAEAFLSKHLGGRYEPIGATFKGSSITVPEGAAQVPGLAGALTGGRRE